MKTHREFLFRALDLLLDDLETIAGLHAVLRERVIASKSALLSQEPVSVAQLPFLDATASDLGRALLSLVRHAGAYNALRVSAPEVQ